MYRILVCDDEEEIVSSLTACLTAEGYQVVTARTGWEVLNILSKQPIHLALLGTKLPGLDGLTTVTRLRQTHDLPVILLTSGTDSTENILGLTIGADDYITKPFQQAELLVLGGITTVTEWNQIRTSSVKKFVYVFTFPLFMFTYIPISLAAFFCKPQWKPIEHRVSAAHLRSRDRQEVLPF